MAKKSMIKLVGLLALLGVLLAGGFYISAQNHSSMTTTKNENLDKNGPLNQKHQVALGVKNEGRFYGTLTPFAKEAVYFLMTDRFVNGDPKNDYPQQGGKHPSYRLALISDKGETAYVGYMGGDFKGILSQAKYIKNMGFTSIWLTPIVDQPDEAFSGGEKIEYGGAFKDGGKTGYHGYWGSNFFKVDEHLPSSGLSFKQLTQKLRHEYDIKTVLDIVLNHGSPAYSMKPKQQPKFGQVFDQNNKLVADQQNLPPQKLDAQNPLHKMYSHKPDIMQLSDFDPDSPLVLDYFVKAYSQWIDQGTDAFRIDTIKHMPHAFWKKFTQRIRQNHPGFFMFAESYSFDADFIAQHTLKKNEAVSVLDFPGRNAMLEVFEDKSSDYHQILKYLHLTYGPYQNPYDLMTFYDNHDMRRFNSDANGYIDLHNWLFTSRGIPVVYYGSEMAFMSGKKEHAGNRNYFGIENIKRAKQSPIYQSLAQIANIRKNSIALQQGLQANIFFKKDLAYFYRVYQNQDKNQTALVLLNKGNTEQKISMGEYLAQGSWVNQINQSVLTVTDKLPIELTLKAHSVEVYLLNEKNNNPKLIEKLKNLMLHK
ncbi:MAG: alpha-amylase family glycosyl hydrolase [Enterobacterales bacterium]|nr:alpha-amylase family glycosyl hydrolase [Enterobacterales bacterium]